MYKRRRYLIQKHTREHQHLFAEDPSTIMSFRPLRLCTRLCLSRPDVGYSALLPAIVLHIYNIIVETGGFPPVPVEFCSNGVIGVESNGFCCEGGCGTCGGSGCARRPGGPVRWYVVSMHAAVGHHFSSEAHHLRISHTSPKLLTFKKNPTAMVRELLLYDPGTLHYNFDKGKWNSDD